MGGIRDAAAELTRVLAEKELRIVCAESCTGGMVTAALTDLPGSSRLLWGGVAAYSNGCKERLLGVSAEAIAQFGAVSREVAGAMAAGALAASGSLGEGGADLALAVTGIAGPEGGSDAKPVGLVWFALASAGGSATQESALFEGDREAVRSSATERAMRLAADFARGIKPTTRRY